MKKSTGTAGMPGEHFGDFGQKFMRFCLIVKFAGNYAILTLFLKEKLELCHQKKLFQLIFGSNS